MLASGRHKSTLPDVQPCHLIGYNTAVCPVTVNQAPLTRILTKVIQPSMNRDP